GARSLLRVAPALARHEGGLHDAGHGAFLPPHRGRARAARSVASRGAARARRRCRGAVRVRLPRHARVVQRGIRSGARVVVDRDRESRVGDPRGDHRGLRHLRPAARRRAVQVRPRRQGPLARAARGDTSVTRRIAMLSVHACPLAKLGGRDSGGMNVYVREVARALGKRGIEVDVFTRWRERYDPRIQQLGENARVIHIESGPIGYWPKMDVYDHLDEFTTKLDEYVAAEGRSYDLMHAH